MFSAPGLETHVPLSTLPSEWTQLPPHSPGPCIQCRSWLVPTWNALLPGCLSPPLNSFPISPPSGSPPRQHPLVQLLPSPHCPGRGCCVSHTQPDIDRLWAALIGGGWAGGRADPPQVTMTHQACGFLFTSPLCRLHWEWGLRWYVSCRHSFSMAPSASPSCRVNHGVGGKSPALHLSLPVPAGRAWHPQAELGEASSAGSRWMP